MTKLVALPADAAPTGDDLFYMVGAPGTVPVDRKVEADDVAVSTPFASRYVPQESVATVAGVHVNTPSPTYGAWFTFGNTADSMGFAGTPPGDEEAWAGGVFYSKFGDLGGSNAPVEHTTQSLAVLANYYGPTADDSAQASSFWAALADTGTSFTQTKPLTVVEAHAAVLGDNDLSGGSSEALSFGARFTNGTGHVDKYSGFAVSGATNAGTIGTWYGFRQKTTPGGTVAIKIGMFLIDPAVIETGIFVEKTGTTARVQIGGASIGVGSGGAAPALVYVGMPNVTGGEAELRGIKIQQGAGGVSNMQEWWLTGGTFSVARVTRFGSFLSCNAFQLNDSTDTTLKWKVDSTEMTLGDGVDMVFGTANGTIIGMATNQKVGFHGVPGTIQGAAVADPTGGATVDTECRAAVVALISRIEAKGLIAA